MKLMAHISGALLLAVTLSGCSLLPKAQYQETSTFDLAVPVTPAEGYALRVEKFRNQSNCKYKMVYRAHGVQVLVDEYNRWAQAPGVMVSRYLSRALISGEKFDTPKYVLSGEIIGFETDLDAGKCRLDVRYVVRSSSMSDAVEKSRQFRFEAPFSAEEPAAFAQAMSKAVSELADQVSKDLAALK